MHVNAVTCFFVCKKRQMIPPTLGGCLLWSQFYFAFLSTQINHVLTLFLHYLPKKLILFQSTNSNIIKSCHKMNSSIFIMMQKISLSLNFNNTWCPNTLSINKHKVSPQISNIFYVLSEFVVDLYVVWGKVILVV